MKVAHYDCFSGISGDMTLGALIDLGVSADAIRTALDSLGLPIKMKVEKVRKGGFAATFVEIEAQDEKNHRHLPLVETFINQGTLTPKQRDVALRIFRKIAEAEAKVHGIALEKVHFHEVGALDSIADIVGAAVGLDLLGVERLHQRSGGDGIRHREMRSRNDAGARPGDGGTAERRTTAGNAD